MPRRLRLDAELVRRGLARSRSQASSLIAAGRVRVNGLVAEKAATAVTTDADLVLTPGASGEEYVGRGGHKLAGALAAFTPSGFAVAGRRALDAGASTGGFTDVLLRAGAREVVAVDVGYGQLAWELRSDPRVLVRDRTNLRDLDTTVTGGLVDIVVADVSFISLRLVLPAFVRVADPAGDMALMVKPQFEVGRARVGRGGVVRDQGDRADAVVGVSQTAASLGWGTQAVVPSPLPGPSGNVEFFLWLRAGGDAASTERVETVVRSAGDAPGPAPDRLAVTEPDPTPVVGGERPAGSGGPG